MAAAGRRKAEEMARGHRIPDQSGSTGPVSYHVSGSKSLISVKKMIFFPSYSADGSFDATVGDMSTTFYIRVGADTRGRPHVSRSYLGCCNADHVSVDLHGQPGWISDKAAAYLQDYVNDEACPQIFPEITNMINQQLRSLTMLEEIYDGLELDYSFVSNPRMQMSSFDINHKILPKAGSREEASLAYQSRKLTEVSLLDSYLTSMVMNCQLSTTLYYWTTYITRDESNSGPYDR
ncbi:putative bactericidal permeability-increasing protein [Apostichopus japonicus]|uniref:Putative bactericidal permeability-increasing protein n=1 Tax=Stichopus japonicus TaxID=307972 RepID=A0A2G8JE71_STIJA|nr:putative bactericidal permeability-increasing protein [Apostichopus japonicus]